MPATAAALKTALRASTAKALAALSPAEISEQSAAVLAQLQQTAAYTSARTASVYLPIEGGKEVDTWPIVADLLARGASVAVPRVTGPRSMEMLRLASVEQARALPRTKWGIPEPDAVLAAAMGGDRTHGEPPFDLVLVPGVAFDARCNRLGHGRGYYDTFIQGQRQKGAEGEEEEEALAVIGLALAVQVAESVPVGEHDQRLDLIVHPEGRMAYTSAVDGAAAAAAMGGGGGGAAKKQRAEASANADSSDSGSEDGEEQQQLPPIELRVDVAPGTYKYVCLLVTPEEEKNDPEEEDDPEPFLAVRSGRGDYHAQVAAPILERWGRHRCEALGGGRIVRDAQARTVKIYGYSVGFGGDEGGPPGAQMKDHSQVAELVLERYPDHDITYDRHGY